MKTYCQTCGQANLPPGPSWMTVWAWSWLCKFTDLALAGWGLIALGVIGNYLGWYGPENLNTAPGVRSEFFLLMAAVFVPILGLPLWVLRGGYWAWHKWRPGKPVAGN